MPQGDVSDDWNSVSALPMPPGALGAHAPAAVQSSSVVPPGSHVGLWMAKDAHRPGRVASDNTAAPATVAATTAAAVVVPPPGLAVARPRHAMYESTELPDRPDVVGAPPGLSGPAIPSSLRLTPAYEIPTYAPDNGGSSLLSAPVSGSSKSSAAATDSSQLDVHSKASSEPPSSAMSSVPPAAGSSVNANALGGRVRSKPQLVDMRKPGSSGSSAQSDQRSSHAQAHQQPQVCVVSS
jgi:hypothetical protein